MKLEVGELITLDNNKEYVCFSKINDNGIDYVYLISNFKPIEIRFAIEKINDNNIELEIINDKDQKKYVYNLFLKAGKGAVAKLDN